MKTLKNVEAFKLLGQGEKITSTYWSEGYFIQLTEVGILVSRRGLRVEWNELATSLRDSWVIFN